MAEAKDTSHGESAVNMPQSADRPNVEFPHDLSRRITSLKALRDRKPAIRDSFPSLEARPPGEQVRILAAVIEARRSVGLRVKQAVARIERQRAADPGKYSNAAVERCQAIFEKARTSNHEF